MPLVHVVRWMDLENMLSERSQDTYCTITFV